MGRTKGKFLDRQRELDQWDKEFEFPTMIAAHNSKPIDMKEKKSRRTKNETREVSHYIDLNRDDMMSSTSLHT